MSYIITKKTRVTEEDVENIMESAMQGIAYWADEAFVEGLDKETTRISDALQKGKRIRIHDAEAEKSHVLTLKKFLHGLSLMDKWDIEDYDMYDADSVIQYALFGEQVYS